MATTILVGDARDRLRELAERRCVRCLTSYTPKHKKQWECSKCKILLSRMSSATSGLHFADPASRIDHRVTGCGHAIKNVGDLLGDAWVNVTGDTFRLLAPRADNTINPALISCVLCYKNATTIPADITVEERLIA